jgi:hypothetical protein
MTMRRTKQINFCQKIIFSLYERLLPFLSKKLQQRYQTCYKYSLNQREKEAADYQQKSKRPKDNDLTPKNLCLFEIYFIEDLDKLEEGLDRIYTAKDRFDTRRTIENYKNFINNCVQNFNYGGWCNLNAIGPIENKKGRYFPGFLGACLPDFPEDVKFITLKLLRITPSIICLIFDAELSENVSSKLDDLLNKKFYGELTFYSFWPWRGNCSLKNCSYTKEEAIRHYFDSIKVNIEKFLSKYLKGFYLSQDELSHPKCPSLEFFTITDLPEPAKIDDLFNKEKDFWLSLGFEWYYSDMIFCNDYTYYFDSTYFTDYRKPTRILFIKRRMEALKKSTGSIESAIYTEKDEFIHGYTNSIIVLRLFNKIWEIINRQRLLLGSKILSKHSGREFRDFVLLNKELVRNLFFFNRLSSDYDLVKNQLKVWNRDARHMTSLREVQGKVGKVNSLAEEFVARIDRQMNLVRDQYEVIKSTVNYYLTGKYIEENYNLQNKMVILTIGILLLTVILIIIAIYPALKGAVTK